MTDLDDVKHICERYISSFLEEILTEAKAMRARQFLDEEIEPIGVSISQVIDIIEEIKEERKEDEKR